eukprot:CAMPEP_0206439006 /NCGR_PEP_ID=MMETSP0324_2-20121206/11961_1 /ASSEMBLY_ACC=CAM_ASM_000836 /TAXON_ID=2866 /ORGANISM="Crypthecodinium cohnii, Strain Seligo" /LENGTH=331 /DNA_ID=CAMNT_0053906559 /DNA_START=1 /DNA_END=996 /DNA_ORIENTATION=-
MLAAQSILRPRVAFATTSAALSGARSFGARAAARKAGAFWPSWGQVALGGASAACLAALLTNARNPLLLDDAAQVNLKPWEARWNKNMLGWHLKNPNPILVKYLDVLLPPPAKEGEPVGAGGLGYRVLFPLCGKTVDMVWLARQGYRVVGIEGVEQAIVEFASEHSASKTTVKVMMPPEISPDDFTMHAMIPTVKADEGEKMPQPIMLLLGDFFGIGEKEAAALVPFDACLDRGSMVAIKPELRQQYIKTLHHLMAPGGRVLLVTTEHDKFADGSIGPPHEITENDLKKLAEGLFEVKQLERTNHIDMEDTLKRRGATYHYEAAYLLTKKK